MATEGPWAAVAKAAPLGAEGPRPVVLGHSRRGVARGTLASQPGLQHSQSPAFCPRDSQGPPGPPLHPYPSPRKPHWQESHPEWGYSLMPSAKGNPDVHVQPQKLSPTCITGQPTQGQGCEYLKSCSVGEKCATNPAPPNRETAVQGDPLPSRPAQPPLSPRGETQSKG